MTIPSQVYREFVGGLMRIVAVWSGGKDGYTAFHKAVEQGHDVAYLLTYVFAGPSFFTAPDD